MTKNQIKVEFHELNHNGDEESKRDLKYVVMQTRYKNQWVFVRHKKRRTWENPGGHIEIGEKPDDAATREMIEETGAIKFTVEAVCDYSVTFNGSSPSYGRLYYCVIEELGDILTHEIEELMFCDQLPEELTYPEIQPYLFEYTKQKRRMK